MVCSSGNEMLDWVYIAGLFDGEGCLAIQPRVCMVSISNRHLPTLTWLKSFTGMGRIKISGGKTIKSKITCYEWILTTGEVRKFLPIILPYLRINKKRAEAMLEYLDGLRLGNNLISKQELLKRSLLKSKINGRELDASYFI